MSDKLKVGKRGVITLPARLRKKYGLNESDDLLVEETPEGLLLKPLVSMPVELYSEERIQEFSKDDQQIADILEELDPPQQ